MARCSSNPDSFIRRRSSSCLGPVRAARTSFDPCRSRTCVVVAHLWIMRTGMPSHGQPSVGSSLNQLLDRLADEFEDAWQSGVESAPQISDFLKRLTVPDDIHQRCMALIRLIPLDLEHRWRRAGTAETSSGGTGDSSIGAALPAPEFPPRPLVEHYLKRFPELAGSSRRLVEVVKAETRVRSAMGETRQGNQLVGLCRRHGCSSKLMISRRTKGGAAV